MRIISGARRGRKLYAPKGLTVRPTSDRVKEAVFNILGDAVREARVLDLFAGVGGLGLEALSRGAGRVVFVDQDSRSVDALTRNASAMFQSGQFLILRLDATRPSVRIASEGPYDLIFLDPPYNKGLAVKALKTISRQGLAASGCLAVVEHDRREDPAIDELAGWGLSDRRLYGKTHISFLSPAE